MPQAALSHTATVKRSRRGAGVLEWWSDGGKRLRVGDLEWWSDGVGDVSPVEATSPHGAIGDRLSAGPEKRPKRPRCWVLRFAGGELPHQTHQRLAHLGGRPGDGDAAGFERVDLVGSRTAAVRFGPAFLTATSL